MSSNYCIFVASIVIAIVDRQQNENENKPKVAGELQ